MLSVYVCTLATHQSPVSWRQFRGKKCVPNTEIAAWNQCAKNVAYFYGLLLACNCLQRLCLLVCVMACIKCYLNTLKYVHSAATRSHLKPLNGHNYRAWKWLSSNRWWKMLEKNCSWQWMLIATSAQTISFCRSACLWIMLKFMRSNYV